MAILLLLLSLFALTTSLGIHSPLRQHGHKKSSTVMFQSKEFRSHDMLKSSSCHRRQLLLSWAPLVLLSSSATASNANDDTGSTNANNEEDEVIIYQLASGVQFRNIRQGGGPPITTASSASLEGEEEGRVVLHLRAVTRDGVVLLDTFNQSPILYQLGTAQNFDVFGGDSSKRPMVTQGVEDAILSRGKTVAVTTSGIRTPTVQKVQPMREGGIRRVIVSSALAYGNAGVSRYDAFRMGLQHPVARDADIFYDIEVLRCNNVEVEVPRRAGSESEEKQTATVQACCIEDNYPCNIQEPKQQ